MRNKTKKIKFVSNCCKGGLERVHGGITGFECKKCKKPCNQEVLDLRSKL